MIRNGDAPVMSLREAMDRLLEQSFTPFSRSGVGEVAHSMPVNLWEDQNGYYLHLLAPALDISTVEITAINGILTVSGQMTQPQHEGAKSIWSEWSPSAFRRQLQLPAGFDADRCEATYKDGVLTISVPKPEQAKPKAIKVQVKE